MNARYVADSRTEQVQILTLSSLNGTGRLFGGKLMEWIDMVAGVVARRHSSRNATTASVDRLDFLGAARSNDLLVLSGRVTYVGRTSMEVCVETYVEALDGGRSLVNRAYLVMVALDDDERPTPVPGLILSSDQEREDWARGEQRRRARQSPPSTPTPACTSNQNCRLEPNE